MRSSSRRPWLSNRQSSIFCALAENIAKLVPRPSQVAPSGCGEPALSRTLAFRNEKECRKRWNDKTDLGDHAFVQRPHRASVPDVAAAINSSIGVEHFAPGAGQRHLDAIVAVHLGREVDDYETPVARLAAFAQPGKDAAVGVVHDQPFETGGLAIELVERRMRAVETIEVANQ